MTDQFAGHEIARHEITRQEIAGHENDGPKMTTGLEMAGEKVQYRGMQDLYSVYSTSNVRRLCALLCPAISFLHFHVLQFHALQIGPLISRPHFHVQHFQRPQPSEVCKQRAAVLLTVPMSSLSCSFSNSMCVYFINGATTTNFAINTLLSISSLGKFYQQSPSLVVFQSVHGDDCRRRYTRQISTLVITEQPTSCSTCKVIHLWPRSFAVAGPAVWNSLPEYLRDPELSIDSCRRQLKTFLFAQY